MWYSSRNSPNPRGAFRRWICVGACCRNHPPWCKPGNVMLRGSGDGKIVETAYREDPMLGYRLSEQISMGTPCYMSPEQLQQRPVNHRTRYVLCSPSSRYELLTLSQTLLKGDTVQQVSSECFPVISTLTYDWFFRTLAPYPEEPWRYNHAIALKTWSPCQGALAAVRGQIQRPVFSGSEGRLAGPRTPCRLTDFPRLAREAKHPTAPGCLGSALALALFALLWRLARVVESPF